MEEEGERECKEEGEWQEDRGRDGEVGREEEVRRVRRSREGNGKGKGGGEEEIRG